MKKRFLLTFVLFQAFMPSLSSLDLSGSLHVDTYAGRPTAGFSFLAQENIIKGLAIRSQADYLTANSYDVQNLAIGELSLFTIGAGFALEIESNPTTTILPGISFLLGMQLTKRMEMLLSSTLFLSPAKITKLFGFKANAQIAYNTDNAHSFARYTIQGAQARGFIHRFAAEVEAFEKGIPIALILGSGVDLFMTRIGQFDLDVGVTGGFSVNAGKYGKYFAKAKVGVLHHQKDIGLPYDIVVGASFSL